MTPLDMEQSMDSLRQNEKDELEQRIIAYFEGSLDKEASSTLMADVAKTTEGRALFASHENLARIISAARIPLEAPMAVREGIAARIPGLAAWIPGLIGTAQLAPVVSQSVNPIIAFLTKIPLSTAISVGASVAVLTTATVVVKNNLDDNVAPEHKAKSGVVQQASPTKPEAPLYSTLPQRDLATPDLGSANASLASDAIEEPLTSKATHKLAHTPITKEPAQEGATHSISSRKNIGRKALLENNLQPSPPTTEALEQTIRPVASLASANAILPNGLSPSSFATLPMMVGEASRIRPFIALGTSVQLARADNTGLVPSDNGAISFDMRIGADIAVSGPFSVRVQGGSTEFAREFDRDGSSSIGIRQTPTTYTSVNTRNAFWATGGLSYRLYAADIVPLTISASVGAAFLNTIAPMGEIGISTEIPVSENFAVRPGFVFDVVSTTAEDLKNHDLHYPTVVNREFSEKTLLSQALGVSLGFTYRY